MSLYFERQGVIYHVQTTPAESDITDVEVTASEHEPDMEHGDDE